MASMTGIRNEVLLSCSSDCAGGPALPAWCMYRTRKSWRSCIHRQRMTSADLITVMENSSENVVNHYSAHTNMPCFR
jgi:hypothetical protein